MSLQRRGVLAAGQRAAGPGEVVAHRAVDAEQLAAAWRRRRPRRWSYSPRRGRPGRGPATRRRRPARRSAPRRTGLVLARRLDVGAATAASGRCPPGSRPRRRRRRRGWGRALRALGVEAVAASSSWRGTASCPPRRLAGSAPWRRCGRLGREGGVGGAGQEQAEQEQDGDRGRVPAAGGQCVHGALLSSCGVGRSDQVGGWMGSLQQVDHDEQGDPHDVDEVPVVGRHDGAGGLGVACSGGS